MNVFECYNLRIDILIIEIFYFSHKQKTLFLRLKQTENMGNKQQVRINETILGPFERPALQWFAKHMPYWINSDHLTTIGFLGSLCVFAGFGLTTFHPAYAWLACAGFIINWFGDSLDGTLARYRKIERPNYGFFIDHIIDSISIFLIYTGLGLSPYVSLEIALLGVIGYLLMSIYTYLITYIEGVFKISYGKIGPTEVRVFGIMICILIYIFGTFQINVALPFYRSITFFDILIILLSITFFVTFVCSSLKTARILERKDSEKLQ